MFSSISPPVTGKEESKNVLPDPNSVVISNDGGTTFQVKNEGLPNYVPRLDTLWGQGYARAMTVDPKNPQVLYLGIDGSPEDGTSGGNIFKSDNGGPIVAREAHPAIPTLSVSLPPPGTAAIRARSTRPATAARRGKPSPAIFPTKNLSSFDSLRKLTSHGPAAWGCFEQSSNARVVMLKVTLSLARGSRRSLLE